MAMYIDQRGIGCKVYAEIQVSLKKVNEHVEILGGRIYYGEDKCFHTSGQTFVRRHDGLFWIQDSEWKCMNDSITHQSMVRTCKYANVGDLVMDGHIALRKVSHNEVLWANIIQIELVK
jgi:hypothetical protein